LLAPLAADRAGKPPTLSSLADDKRVGSLLLSTAARAPLFDCSLPLAAMFAELPPSSSELTERKSVVPPAPPAHSSPLGLVLAALAQFVLRSAARTSRIRLLRRRSQL
jgi:hypothetical protein